uniref:P-type ATPase A domain-containing protein n=1 Tax=Electrophorus electricus TaxID=8005 RepID=A0A4W4G1E9_ELEEL
MQVLNPFYMFQVFSIILWMSDKYYYYAVCIFIISFISITVSLYEIRKASEYCHIMCTINVPQDRFSDKEELVSSVELVPGDCVIVPSEGLLMPCDAALLAGECMVNESMLTGESVPVMKTPLPDNKERYSPEAQRRHTLFCGTQVIQAKGGHSSGNGAVVVVTRTGFFTAKGDLVSSILYPQPVNFRFYQDAMKFLIFLGCMATLGTIYSIVMLYRSNVSNLVIRSLDIVTIVVPPALPAALTTGTLYAQRRLKKRGVFCISPPRINVCGKISLFCFDKTGTLTEEGLDVWGVKCVSGTRFDELIPDPRLLPPGPMVMALASCHSVALLGDQAIGDPLELKMIESTGWELEELTNETGVISEFGSYRILMVMRPPAAEFQPTGIVSTAHLRRFPFSSTLQRMSVVTVGPGGDSPHIFLKGAPEMVASHCLSITRAEVEKDLLFLGLLVMKNQVKPESAEVIGDLRRAQIRPVMVTGDNILTALNVAQSCRMLLPHEQVIFVHASPPAANSMASLQFQRMSLLQVLMRGTIYARMSPDQKTELVRGLQKLNYRVGMCGDGANDCGALRAADVGVSLSEAEASVASPFTSKSDNISCVPLLIREGRCSLVTSFSLFKYMALYSLIQFASVLILYTVKTNLSDLQFLFFDLAMVTVLAIVMGRGGPSDELHPRRPPCQPIGSACSVLFGSTHHSVDPQPGGCSPYHNLTGMVSFRYIPLNSTEPGSHNLPNMEDTSVFAVSGLQYIIMSIVVTKGYPYKKPLFHNVVFVLVLLVQFGVMIWLVLFPETFLHKMLQLYEITDMSYKLLLVAIAALNFFICCLLEALIDKCAPDCLRILRGNRSSKKQYKRLDALLAETPSWPPLDQLIYPPQCSVIGVS